MDRRIILEPFPSPFDNSFKLTEYTRFLFTKHNFKNVEASLAKTFRIPANTRRCFDVD